MRTLLNLLVSPWFLQLLMFGSAFVGAFLLTLHFWPDEKEAAAKKRLGVLSDSERPSKIALLRWFRPFYTLFVPHVSSRIQDSTRTSLHRKLLSANLRDEITPDEFVALQWVMTLFIPFLLIYLSGALGEPLPIPFWPVTAVGGFYFPKLWLSQRISLRRRSIVRAMPYTLDLLTLSVEAGLDFIAAIQRLTQRTKSNSLLVEFNHMLKEIRLGTARSDALRSLSDRLQIEEITSFTTLLIQADQLGASIGNVLRAQSEQLRSQRFQAAETAGAKASQLILFPLVFCIFPAIFIVILGPTLLTFLQRGLF
jgi:tight adherence protein C